MTLGHPTEDSVTLKAKEKHLYGNRNVLINYSGLVIDVKLLSL